MNKFRERFTELLKEKGLSQTQQAKEMQISKQTITNYKSGFSEPRIDDLIKIANYFNVCIDYIVGRQDYY